jgi:tagaturonate epimerase
MQTHPSSSSSLRAPSPLGLKKSFGYGDRLGLATSGHLATHRKFDFAPIFAQQSIREMTRTNRTPQEVMEAARRALAAEGFAGEWGADADHLKNLEDVQRTSDAGFCFFTIDPSEFVENRADGMSPAELSSRIQEMEAEKTLPVNWRGEYEGKRFEVYRGTVLQFDREALDRAAVKYARAIAHTARMAEGIARIRGGQPFEIEVSVDETDSPTSPLEHLFYGQELKRAGVEVVSLAPRFVGEFEKGIDYKGDTRKFEETLRQHVAIARFCGPYKISVHSGSDKFAIYPAIGRICGDLLHVKTAGTSYLEALRCVLRVNTDVFREIAAYCAERFATDRASYHISTTEAQVKELFRDGPGGLEERFLEGVAGRQLLHVTFGSVLTIGKNSRGRFFKEEILEILQRESSLYSELLEKHFDRHLRELTRG